MVVKRVKIYTQEQIEKIDILFDDLKFLNNSLPVIVEGKKDELALREVGLDGEIIKISSSLRLFCEKLAKKYNEVIILTDWDKKGSTLFRVIKRLLQANGVKCNDRIRENIIKYVRKEIKDVEGLAPFLRNIHTKVI